MPAISPATEVPWSRVVTSTPGIASNSPEMASLIAGWVSSIAGVDDGDADVLAIGAVSGASAMRWKA